MASALRSLPTQCLVMVVDDGSPEWKETSWAEFPSSRLVLHHFPKNDRNLTRSWNWGLLTARELGLTYAVAGNSDVRYPLRWWEAMEAVLDDGTVALAGPMTNAPGHRPRQKVTEVLKGYELRDDDAYLDGVSEKLLKLSPRGVKTCKVNGFCMAARVDTWWRGAFDAAHVFNPGDKFKLTRNEDELQGRWDRLGLTQGAVRGSFVFHYRGVSRKGATSGPAGKGHFRPK